MTVHTTTTPPAAEVGYLGWSGRGNLGDDALLEVIRDNLPEARLTFPPMDVGGLVRHLAKRPAAGRSTRHLVLGGGTAVGRANWRAAVHASAISCGASRHLIGVGVEDPAFGGLHSFSGRGELARWRSVLSSFSAVTVRGPRSAELLDRVGVQAEVVGDPALLLAPSEESSDTAGLRDTRTIAVSLGFGDDLWGHDHASVVAVVIGALARLAQDGWAVRLIVMNRSDEAHAQQIAAALEGYDVLTERPTTAAEFFAAVAPCSVMLAERLHAGVLAACADLPVVMVEYQPKCRDFMRSIGADELTVRTDALGVRLLLDLVERAVSDESMRAGVATAVARMRGQLGEQVALLRADVLSGSTGPSELAGQGPAEVAAR